MRKWLLWNKKNAVFCTQILQYYSSKQKYTSLRLCSIDRMYKIFKVSLQNYQWAASASISRSRRRTIKRCTDGHRQNVQGLCAHVIPFPIPVRSRLLIYDDTYMTVCVCAYVHVCVLMCAVHTSTCVYVCEHVCNYTNKLVADTGMACMCPLGAYACQSGVCNQ